MSETNTKKHQLPKLLRSRVPYTICIVLFSLLLAAVIAVRIFVPAAVSFPGNVTETDFSSFEMPGGGFDTSEMPSGDFDTSEMPGMPSEDFDASAMPSGDFDTSEMPSGFETSSTPSGGMPSADSSASDGSETASDSDADTSGFTVPATQSSGLLSTVRSHWIVFAVIFAVLDILSIVLLILVSRKYHAAEDEASDSYAAKRPAAMWPAVVAVIAAIAVIIGLFPVSSASEDEISAVDEIVSGTAEAGDVEDTLVTTGVLADDEGTDIEYPEAVKLTARLVSNGDTVSAGDILAAADTASVMTAIEELQEQLNLLDEALEESSDEEISAKLTSTVSGRVKAIYAEKGTDVLDTMNEYGCLMRISLDGCMAVDIDAGSLTAGDSVTVTLSDGTELNGKVSEINAGTAVITVSDKKADIDDAAAVSKDGAELGSGNLYIHSELLVTGYSGTVSSVKVSENEKIDDGDTLLKLKNVEYTAVYDSLLSQREELVEELDDLFVILQTGCIAAESDGTVSGIDEDLPLVSDTSPVKSATASTTPVTYSTAPVSSDAEGDNEEEENPEAGNGSGEEEKPEAGNGSGEQETPGAGSGNEQQENQNAQGNKTEDTDDKSSSEEDISSEEKDEKTDPPEEEPVTEENKDTGNYWIAQITSLNFTDGVCTASITYVTSTDATSENAAAEYAAGTPVTGTISLTNFSGSLNVGSLVIISQPTTADQTITVVPTSSSNNNAGNGGTPSEEKSTDTSATDPGKSDNEDGGDTKKSDDSDNKGGVDTSTGDNTLGGTPTTNWGTTLTVTTATAEEEEEEETFSGYEVEKVTLCTVTPQDVMTIDVSIDELDILSVSTGTEVTVLLDALSGQSFTGTITAIDGTGTNSGGNTKYTATVTLDRTDEMLAGMNTSVRITRSANFNTLLIPVAALNEENGSVYVYTGYDEKKDTLTDPVEVTTGLSDGTNVEILSGLEAGDTYYYSYADTIVYNAVS